MAQEIATLRFPFQLPATELPQLIHDFRSFADQQVSLVVTYPESPPPQGEGMFSRRGGPWVFVSVQVPVEHLLLIKSKFDEIIADFLAQG